MSAKVPEKISSGFALLDVKAGRAALGKYYDGGPNGRYREHYKMKRIPVTIKGVIACQWGGDDGVSAEFCVDVSDVKLGKPRA